MSYKNAIISLFIILVVGIATWLTLSFYWPTNIATASTSELPDAYMENVEAVVMDKLGQPTLKLNTPRMLHFETNNIAQLKTPYIILYRGLGKPWFINATYGKASHGIDQVDFWDKVTIFHPEDAATPNTWIKTNTLTLHPHDQTAFTNDIITLTQSNLLLQAIGMQANMKTGDIKLLSHARAEYNPNV